jgi:hypothetical protein
MRPMVYNEKMLGEVISKKTITKFCVFVILVVFGVACEHTRSSEPFDVDNSPYDPPKVAGHIESKDIKEASGLAASKCQPNVLWTHNDSGDDAFIFAISTTGKHLGTWKIKGATNQDWEDIALTKTPSGECQIYIGDIGNNGKDKGEGTIYRVKEPNIEESAQSSSRKSPLTIDAFEALQYSLDTRSDAESLLVHPTNGDVYILTKRKEGPSSVYKLAPNFGGQPVTGAKIGEISMPAIIVGLLTGGDISPDGKRVVLCDYVAGYELTLPNGAKNFDDIWKQKIVKFDIGKREVGEAIAYSADGNTVYSTSEGANAPIYEMTRKQK